MCWKVGLLCVGVPRGVYERYSWCEVLGEFAIIGPGREEQCGPQGVYGCA
jgi:hypothetical protein